MTIWYCDPVDGSNSNAGTAYDSPKKDATSFTLVGGQNQLLFKKGTTWHSPKVSGGAALQPNISGAGVDQEFIIGVYDPVTGARVTGEKGVAGIDAGSSDWGITFPGNRSHLLIEGIEVSGIQRNSLDPVGIYHSSGSGTNIKVKFCKVHGVVGTNAVGIKILAPTALIFESDIYDTDTDGVYFAATGVTIERNKIWQVAKLGGGGGDCIQGSGTLTGSRVRANHCDHSTANEKQCIIVQDTSGVPCGIIIDQNACIAADPNLPLNSVNAMKTIYAGGLGIQVLRNRVTGGEHGIFLEPSGGSAGAVVDGNVVTLYDPLQLYGISPGSNVASCRNNTVVHTAQNPAAQNVGISQFSTTTSFDARNNIVKGFRYGIRSAALAAGLVHHNCIAGCTVPLADNAFSTIALDAASFIDDPQLDRYYRTGPGSPCYHAGTYLDGVRDFYGRKLRNPPDIGALQYFASRTAVSPKRLPK